MYSRSRDLRAHRTSMERTEKVLQEVVCAGGRDYRFLESFGDWRWIFALKPLINICAMRSMELQLHY